MFVSIFIINGPNLNLLGEREKAIYGDLSLDEICNHLQRTFAKHCKLNFFQSNNEGAIIDQIQQFKLYDGLVINPGAYSHTSYAIRDAIQASLKPSIEVHLTNIFKRENFRHVSVIAPACIGCIVGLGEFGYELAVTSLLKRIV